MFDPSQKFDVVDTFDPDQPFETMEEEDQGAVGRVANAIAKNVGISESPENMEIVDPNDPGTLADMGAGFVQGGTLGFGDEMGAGVQSILDKLLGGISNTEEDLKAQGFKFGEGSELSKDLYSQSLQENRQKNTEAQERSPIAYGGGEILGGITSSIPAGAAGLAGKGAIKAATKLGAKVGAAEGAGYSEGSLMGDSDDQAKVLADTLGGAAFGAAFGAGSQLASDKVSKSIGKLGDKLSSAIDESDYLRGFKKSYEYGKQGFDLAPASESKSIARGEKVVQDLADTYLDDMTSKIMQLDKNLGQNVGNSLDQAAKEGIEVLLSPEMILQGERTKLIIERLNDMSIAPSRYSKVTGPLFDKMETGKLNPVEAKELFKRVDEAVTNLYSKNEIGAAKELQEFAKSLHTQIKDQIPGYSKATGDLRNYREKFVERILGKGQDPEYNKIRFSNINDKAANVREKLVSSVADKFTAGGGKRDEARKIVKGIYDYAQDADPEFLKVLGVKDAEELLKKVVDTSDARAVAFRGTRNPGLFSGAGEVKGEFKKGILGAGDEFLIREMNRLGSQKGIIGTPAKVAKSLYAAPKEKLYKVADTLERYNQPYMSDMLRKSLDSDNINAKNAALFVIMQNPNARLLISGQDIEDEENGQ